MFVRVSPCSSVCSLPLPELTSPPPALPRSPCPRPPSPASKTGSRARGWTPFDFQREVWEAYRAGESGLIHAGTGTGKTYAAWLGPLLEWMETHEPDLRPRRRAAAPPLRVLWLTPLRALAADTEAALRAPLAELGHPLDAGAAHRRHLRQRARARSASRSPPRWSPPPRACRSSSRQPDARELFAELRLVVVDEWHELLGNKRGVQTELALARLRALAARRCAPGGSRPRSATSTRRSRRCWASAHERPSRARARRRPRRRSCVDSLIPPTIERFPWAGHLGLADAAAGGRGDRRGRDARSSSPTRARRRRSGTRRSSTRAPTGPGEIALHHGSLDRKTRDFVEDGLRGGRAALRRRTSSLDLGVDFSPVDRVLQVGSPKGVARLLQRAGRSGHRPGAQSRVTCVPDHALELVEVAAARDGAGARPRSRARPPVERPLDVLAQHVVTVALGGGFRADELLAEVRTTHGPTRPHATPSGTGCSTSSPAAATALAAYPEYRRVVRAGRPLHRAATGRGAAAPDGDRHHHQRRRRSPSSTCAAARLGTVEESFIARLKPGDRFFFAGEPLEFVRVRDMKAWVRRATRLSGAIPRWMGSRMPLSTELAAALRRRLEEASSGEFRGPEMEAVRPILRVQARWSRVPRADELLIERVKTREGHHLFFFPFEGRLVHEGLAALLAYRLSPLGADLLHPGAQRLRDRAADPGAGAAGGGARTWRVVDAPRDQARAHRRTGSAGGTCPSTWCAPISAPAPGRAREPRVPGESAPLRRSLVLVRRRDVGSGAGRHVGRKPLGELCLRMWSPRSRRPRAERDRGALRVSPPITARDGMHHAVRSFRRRVPGYLEAHESTTTDRRPASPLERRHAPRAQRRRRPPQHHRFTGSATASSSRPISRATTCRPSASARSC